MSKPYKDEDFMNYIEQRLEHWAEWYSSGNNYGLGFHSETIEYVLMTVGALIKSTGIKPLPCDDEAEEMEALMCDLRKQNEVLAHALRHYYLSGGSLRTKASYLNISYVQFKYYVDMAKQWVAGRLSAKT